VLLNLLPFVNNVHVGGKRNKQKILVALSDNDSMIYRKNQHIGAGFNQNQSWWDMGTTGAKILGEKVSVFKVKIK
jgi:hypothetical protein